MQFNSDEIDAMYREIGLKVKMLRESRAMSQLELSLEMGNRSVSLVSAAELCKDSKHFNIEHLYKIAKIFEVEMSYFFERN